MEEKLAVHCPTRELFGKVMKKINSDRGIDRWDNKEGDTHLEISPCKDEFDGKYCFVRDGYKIISATEYLNEGGEDVSEFKVGDRVECINDSKNLISGHRDTIDFEYGDGTLAVKGSKHVHKASNFKLIGKKTKPKTTKENNMKENNTDSNVLAVFGKKVQGDELVIIDRHFNEQMLTRILMEKHHKAIQEACEGAEAKRLEKEEKDK